jgi:hypothetical protein
MGRSVIENKEENTGIAIGKAVPQHTYGGAGGDV